MAIKKQKSPTTKSTTPTTSIRKPEKKDSLVQLVVKGMQEKKGNAITIVDLRKVKTAVADYFVICSANTDTQLDAIRTSVEEEVYKATGQDVWMKEGLQNREWIVLDYADVVVHIFRTDRREFYGLEDLWGDADITEVEELVSVPLPVKKEKNVAAKTKQVEKVASKKSKTKTNATVAARTQTKVVSKNTTKKKQASKPTAKKASSKK